MLRWAIVLTAVFVLAMLYHLSMGPMFWLCSDASGRVGHDFTSRTFLVVYRPVIWVMQEGPQPFQWMIQSYFGIWEK